MPIPAALAAIPFLAGLATGLLVFESEPTLALGAGGAAAMACLAAASACLQESTIECVVAVVAGCFLAGVSLGTDAARTAYRPPIRTWFESQVSKGPEPVVIRGVLRDDATLTPLGAFMTLDVRDVGSDPDHARRLPARSLGGVRVAVAGALARAHIGEWRAGRTLRVTVLLREPAVFHNPGVPDERRAQARRGVALIGTVKSAALVEVVREGNVVQERAAACRAWIRATIGDVAGRWNPRSGAVATAILIGDRTGLSERDERRMQEAGTYHVIAISGGNIAILTALLLLSMRWLPERTRVGLTLLALLAYGQVAGGTASVDRAIAAAAVYLTGRGLDLSSKPGNVLGVVALGAAAHSPLSVCDPGFLLSFGATLGILAGVPRLTRAVLAPGCGVLLRVAAGLSAATLAAEVALAPIGASLFARVTCAGLLLNFAAIPLMTCVQMLSMVSLGVAIVHREAARACGYLVHVAASGLVDSAGFVDLFPWLSRDVPAPAWWLVAAYYLAVGLTLAAARHRLVTAGIALTSGALIAAGPGATARDTVRPASPGWVRVAFLDVGQGDASLVVLPDGYAMLVDAGGLPSTPAQGPGDEPGATFDVGERVVAPALRALGVRRLDSLVLTHGDPDHIGGVPGVLRIFRPLTIWEGVPVPPHPGLRSVALAGDEVGAEWRTVQAGDRLRIGTVEISTLHPPRPEWERQRVRNDDSVVLVVRIGEVAVVLPGDVGAEGESAARALFEPARHVVLKAAHHGSATSSTGPFLDALRPDVAVFSAGRANRFGHPSPPVVARYRARGVPVFNTATDGAVILDTDGTRVEIAGWTGRNRITLPASRASTPLPSR